MRSRDERGSALVEVVWLAILLLVPLVYVLLAVFDVQRGSFGITAASRAAGRAYVLAPDDEAGLRQARAAARVALADQGMADAPFDLDIRCEPEPRNCHARGSTVTVRLSTRVLLPMAPQALGGDAPSFALDATHRVPVGRYQEGG